MPLFEVQQGLFFSEGEGIQECRDHLPPQPHVMIVETTQRLQDPDPGVRRQSAEVLCTAVIHGHERDAVIAGLVKALGDLHVGVQEAALDALVAQGGTEVARQLFSLLKCDDSTIRNLAVEGLERLAEGTVEVLVEAIDDPDPHIRKIIADLLGQENDSEVVEFLTRLLADSCANVRMAAASSLGSVGHPDGVPGLLQACHDEELWVRFSAIEALGMIGDPSGLPMVRTFLEVSDLTLLCAAVEAIGKLGTNEDIPTLLEMLPTAALPLRHYLFVTIVRLVGSDSDIFKQEALRAFVFKELVSALHAREREVNLAAVQGLRILNDPHATEPLLSVLGQSVVRGDSELCEEISQTLQACGDEGLLIQCLRGRDELIVVCCLEALGAQRSSQAVPSMCDLVRQSEKGEIRLAALRALQAIEVVNSEVVTVAFTAMGDRDPDVREVAVDIVESSGLKEAQPALWDALSQEGCPNVIDAEVRALLAMGDSQDCGVFRRLLRDDRIEVRESAILSCSLGKQNAAQGVMIGCLSDSDWRVRLAVVGRLAELSDPQLLASLRPALSDEHPYVRQAAVQALGAMGTPEAMESLRTIGLRDSDLWVRTRTIEQLSEQRNSEAVPMLLRLLHDPLVPVQMAAIKAVTAFGETQAVPVLRDLQSSGVPEVGVLASEALERLGDPSVSVGHR